MRRKLIILLTGAFIVLSAAGCGNKTQNHNTEAVNSTDTTEYETKEATPAEAEKAENEEIVNNNEEKTTDISEQTKEVKPTEKVKENNVTETKEEKPQAQAFTVEAKTGTKYATQSVNFRKGPSTNYDNAGALSLNEEVSITGQANTGWYEFEKNGAKVYVSDKYLSDTKIEATQAVAKNDNVTKAPSATQSSKKDNSPVKETSSKQDNNKEVIGLPEGDSGFPGLVKLDEDPEYVTEISSKEEAFADQIKHNGWEVGGTYVEYWCGTSESIDAPCSKKTWYVVSPTELELLSDEVVTYEEYLSAGGNPVRGH